MQDIQHNVRVESETLFHICMLIYSIKNKSGVFFLKTDHVIRIEAARLVAQYIFSVTSWGSINW